MSKSAYYIKGAEPAAEPYHYTGCGLDGIYLINGFNVKETKRGRFVSIEGLEELHAAIAVNIATKKKPLQPKEIRFLRTRLGMTQDEFARKINSDVQNIGRWERGEHPVPGTAEFAIRFAYLVYSAPEEDRAELLRVMENSLPDAKVVAEEKFIFAKNSCDDHWERRRAA